MKISKKTLILTNALLSVFWIQKIFAGAMPDFYEDPSINPSRAYQGGEMGDTVDPFTGQLSIVQTDMSIPGDGGLDINIVRWHSSFFRDGVAGGWELHFGMLVYSSNTSTEKFKNPCSYADGTKHHAEPTLVLPGGKYMIFEPVSAGAATLTSSSRWRLVCDSDTKVTITSPDGLKYILERYLIRQTSTAYVKDYWFSVRRIEDPNGNWLEFDYQNNSEGVASEVRRIRSSDGRPDVDFHYFGGKVDADLSSISYNGRSVNYGYEKVDDYHYCLKLVTLPEGQVWTFPNQGSHLNRCKISQIINPLGGSVSYKYETDGKKISTRTVDGHIWSYKYNRNSSEDVTEITSPDGSKVKHHFWGDKSTTSGTRYRIGLPKAVNYYGSGSITPTKSVSYTWSYQTVGYQVQARPERSKVDPDFRAPALTHLVTTLDGTAYTIEHRDFDSYGNVHTIVETGPGTSRTLSRTFRVDTNKWQLHLLDSQAVVGITGNSKNSYDGNGNLLSTTAYGVTTSHSYHGNGNLYTTTAPGNRTTTYTDYRFGIPQTEYQPGSVVLSRKVDDHARVTRETDGRGYSTEYGYDSANRLTSIDHPKAESADVMITYTNSGRTRTITRGHYQQVTISDGLGRVVSNTATDTARNRSITQTQNYDNLGRLAFKSLPGSSHGHYYTYDALGRVKRVTFSSDANLYSENTYLAGNKVQVRDANGNVTTYTYTAYGNPDDRQLTRIDAPEGITTEIGRDALGQVSHVIQNGVARSYLYYPNRYLKSITDPETGTTTFGRDDAGNMTSHQVGSSPFTYYDYDDRNRNWRIRYPDSTANFTFNNNDQLESSSYEGTVRQYKYDKNSNLEWESLHIDNLHLELDYERNNLDQVSALTYPADKLGVRRMINYYPDAFGRETKAAGYATDIQFHPNGQLSQITYGNGIVTSLSINERQLPKNLLVGYGSVLNIEYGFDKSSNLDYIIDHRDALHDLDLGYDGQHRLTFTSGRWGNGNIQYDGLGNITHFSAGTSSLSYGYDANNKLANVSGAQHLSLKYDSYGNVTDDGKRTYGYNHAGLLTQIDGASRAKYRYDANKLRVKKSTGAATSYYFYNVAGDLLGEYRGDGMLLNEYVYAAGKQIARIGGDRLAVLPLDLGDDHLFTLPIFSANTNQVTYYHTDLLGSPIAATDAQGKVLWHEVYKSYGLREKNSTDLSRTPISYTGKPEDKESGLVYMNARYYHPAIGRFMATDPVHFVESNPVSFNRYAYANNNPYKFVDPNGNFAQALPGIVIGALGDAAFQGGMMIIGVQNEFSWREMVASTVGGAVTGGVYGTYSKYKMWKKLNALEKKEKGVFYRLQSRSRADKIMKEQSISGSNWEAGHVFAWRSRPTLQEAKLSGAYNYETLLRFETDAAFRPDWGINNLLKDNAVMSVNPGPVSVRNVTEVDLRPGFFKYLFGAE